MKRGKDMKQENGSTNFFGTAGGRYLITVISAIIIYGVLILALNSNSQVILGITFLVCGYFGWKALTAITPSMFLWMSLAGWAVYYLVKGLLSIIIGAFVAPFQIGRIIGNRISGEE